MEPEPFGARLRRLRQRKGLSVRQLEEAIHVTHGVISRLENQNHAYPTVRVAMSLAKVLGVSTDYLLGMDYDGQHEPAAVALVGAEHHSGSTVLCHDADNSDSSMPQHTDE